MSKVNRLFLFFILLSFFILSWIEIRSFLTIDWFVSHKAFFMTWKIEHLFILTLVYIILFTSMIAMTIPCATVLSFIGGYLFGDLAIVYSVFSMTVGGTLLLIISRYYLRHYLEKRYEKWISYFRKGFHENAFYYLISLRLIPVLPCWVSNISAGILNVRIALFIFATMIGVLPSTVIFVISGKSFEKLVNSDNPIQILYNPSIFISLLGLAMLSLFPVIYKKFYQ